MPESPSSLSFSPGMTIEVRDEEWQVTKATRSVDGWKLDVRGLSEYVRDERAVFYTSIDEVVPFDPADVTPVVDGSAHYRHARLWLETQMRQSPLPLYLKGLSVSSDMLMDPLEYQYAAVRKTLSDDNLRPRVLIADAVGLGKTLEMGMILAELIRRGRGERILVVTPKHVMEQMQQEMWTRFAIPLVRLDSVGIQKVRQKLPASRNPFTYFPRVIVSLDTLKSAKYRAHLEKVHWDAVVIDEIHNATNVGTQNNQLARVLAPTTDALILASATPHNGDPESFKEILRLLDPTSVMPDGTIDRKAIARLVIRRHRHSPEVASVVGGMWAERAEPKNIPVTPSLEERAIAEELNSVWINPDIPCPGDNHLFGWTLTKAFLSSPAALDQSIHNRFASATVTPKEREALERLAELNDKVTANNSQKFAALVKELKAIGVGPRSTTRAVVFSERVASLTWLQENLQKEFKFKEGAVQILHGGLSDQEQMAVIDEFKREDTPIRILVTGDVASEGVNLHSQCHNLIHYDIPWSLIRIQQRNGRVDRYGQTTPPQITTLLLDDESLASEVHVLSRLMDREHEAHEQLGDAASLMGQHSEAREEDAIRDVLRGQRTFEETVATVEEVKERAQHAEDDPDTDPSLLLDALDFDSLFDDLDDDPNEASGDPNSGSINNPQTTAANTTHSLYRDEESYLLDALSEAYLDEAAAPVAKGGVELKRHANGIIELTPPRDLSRVLDLLPQDYLKARGVKDRLSLTTTREQGEFLLKQARTGDSHTTWPTAHFLGPLHPVTDWAADRALSRMNRREIPAVTANVDAPTLLLLGTLTNEHGQVISRSFVSIVNRHGFVAGDALPDVVAWLEAHGFDSKARNAGDTELPDDIKDFIAQAVETARGTLSQMVYTQAQIAQTRITEWQQRAQDWRDNRATVHGTRKLNRIGTLIEDEEKLAHSLAPSHDIHIRPLLLLMPAQATNDTPTEA